MATAEGKEEHLAHVSGSDVVYDNICQPCKTDGRILEAEGRCEDCDEYLCKRCFLAHTVPSVTRHHVMIDKEELNEKTKAPAERKDQCTQRCVLHSDEIIKYFCPTHSFLGCSACIILNHQSCAGTIYIPDAAKNIQNNPDYKKYKDDQVAIEAKNRDIENNVHEKIDDVKKKQDYAVERIRKFHKEISMAFDQAEKDTIKKVETMGKNKLSKLKFVHSKSVALKSEMHTVSSEIELYESKKQYCNLFIALMKTKNQLKSADEQLDEIDCRNDTLCQLIFKPNSELDGTLFTSGLGEICDEIKDINRVEPFTDIVVKSGNDDRKCWISSSVILPDNSLLVADNRNKKLKLIATRQKKLTGELRIASPWDMTVISSNEVAVTLPNAKKIAFVRTSPVLSKCRDICLNGKCNGITINNDNKLIVSFENPDKVVIMDMNGILLSTILANESEITYLKQPLFIAMHSAERTLYISNANSGNVLSGKLDGTVVATYTDSDLKRPLNMCVDSTGMVYVCDWHTHTVHQITKDCKKVKLLLTKSDGLEKPYTISYCRERDMLYIGMRDNDIIKVFKVITM